MSRVTVRALRAAAAPAAVGAALFLLACAAPGIGLVGDEVAADVRLYEEFAERILDGGVPYRTFSLEYPPGALPAFLLPALAPGGDYAAAFRGLMALCGAVAVAGVAATLAAAGASRRRLWAGTLLAALAPLALGPTTLDRYDLWPAALVAVALALLVAGGARAPLALLALAATAKVYPLVLVPAALVWLHRRRGREAAVRAAAWGGAVGAAVLLPFLVVGPGGIRHTASLLVERPLQIESLGGSLVAALDRLGVADAAVRTSFGSQNPEGAAAGPLLAASTLLGLAAVVAAWLLLARRRPDADVLLLGAAAVLCAFVAFGKVLSPQYLIWLVPVVPLVAGRVGAAAGALLLAALGLTRGWFPGRYREVTELGPETWLVVARNAVLVALTLLLLAALAACRGRGRT
jgi:hypothetical protein